MPVDGLKPGSLVGMLKLMKSGGRWELLASIAALRVHLPKLSAQVVSEPTLPPPSPVLLTTYSTGIGFWALTLRENSAWCSAGSPSNSKATSNDKLGVSHFLVASRLPESLADRGD